MLEVTTGFFISGFFLKNISLLNFQVLKIKTINLILFEKSELNNRGNNYEKKNEFCFYFIVTVYLIAI